MARASHLFALLLPLLSVSCSTAPKAPVFEPALTAALEKVRQRDPALRQCEQQLKLAQEKGQRIKPAKMVEPVDPVYLLGNSTRSTDTTLVALVLVDRGGKVSRVHVVSPEKTASRRDLASDIVRRDLIHAVDTAVRKSTFTPARIDHAPADFVLTIPYVFGTCSAAAFDGSPQPPPRSPSDTIPGLAPSYTAWQINQFYRQQQAACAAQNH